MKSECVVKRMERKTVFTDTEEEELAERITKFSNIGMLLTKQIIRKTSLLTM